jgi:hypothetical protein
MTRSRTPVRATRTPLPAHAHISAHHRSTPACGATPQCAADGQGLAGRAGAVPFLRLAPCPAAAPEVGLSRRCRRPGASPPVVCLAAVLMGSGIRSIPNPWVWLSDRYQTHGFRVQLVEFRRQRGSFIDPRPPWKQAGCKLDVLGVLIATNWCGQWARRLLSNCLHPIGVCSSRMLSMGERRAPDAYCEVGRAPTKSAMAFVLILCCGTDAF